MPAFLTSTLGKYLLIGAAFLAWTVYQRETAANRARAECQSEQLQKTLDETLRQRDALDAALADAEKQAAIDDQEMAALARTKGETDDAAKLSSRECVIGDDVVRKLRLIK